MSINSGHWYGEPQSATWTTWPLRLAAIIDQVSRAAAAAAMVLIGLLAVLTLSLVIARYIFNWNHNGFEELKWHLFGTAVMISGAICLRANGHVRVDLLYQKFSKRVQAIVDASGLVLIVVPICALIAWYGALNTIDTFQRGEMSSDAGGLPYRFIPRSTIPIGFALLGLQALAQATRSIVIAAVGVVPIARDADAAPIGDDEASSA